MLETLIISCIIIAVPLKLTNRPLSTYCHTLLIDNGFGSRQRLLCRLHFRLPSKVHSAILFIQQSHHLLLSVISFDNLLLFLNGFTIYGCYITSLFSVCQPDFWNFSDFSTLFSQLPEKYPDNTPRNYLKSVKRSYGSFHIPSPVQDKP